MDKQCHFFFRENSNDLMTVIGAMYASVLFLGINNSATVQPAVAIERTVFYRERAARLYSVLPYAMAQVKYISPLFQRLKQNQLVPF